MAWYDGVLSNTVGVAWRAASGTVDPWTLQQIKDQTASDIAQASGPDADPATLAADQAQAAAEIDQNLTSEGTHPSQAGLNLPGLGVVGSGEFLAKLEKIVYGLIIVGAVGGVLYFGAKYKSVWKK